VALASLRSGGFSAAGSPSSWSSGFPSLDIRHFHASKWRAEVQKLGENDTSEDGKVLNRIDGCILFY